MIAHWVPVNSATSSMVLLIGMAVAIDYSLFYMRREREERAAGRGIAEALRISARTSGRVVVVSGLTVMLCCAGCCSPAWTTRGLAAGSVLVVGLAMVGSVTVLPAVLALLGRWVDNGRVPWLGRRRTTATESRAWSLVARAVRTASAAVGRGRDRGPGRAGATRVRDAAAGCGHHRQPAAQRSGGGRRAPHAGGVPRAATPARVVIWAKNGGTWTARR